MSDKEEVQMDLEEAILRYRTRDDYLDKRGRELLDGTPMAPPIGYKKQPSMIDNIRNMVRSEVLRSHVESAGFETFEEADDFDVGDDYDPTSPYEIDFDPPAAQPQGASGPGSTSNPPEPPKAAHEPPAASAAPPQSPAEK